MIRWEKRERWRKGKDKKKRTMECGKTKSGGMKAVQNKKRMKREESKDDVDENKRELENAEKTKRGSR